MKITYISLLIIVCLFNSLTASAQSWLWGEQGSSALKADVWVNNVATNRTGNVYQTGDFETSISFGNINMFSNSAEFDMYIVKYDQFGNLLWVNQAASSNYDGISAGYSVATDDSDNAYVVGIASDSVAFGSHILYFPDYLGTSFFVAKYYSNGDLAWVQQSDTNAFPYGSTANAVALDKYGHIYVAGEGPVLMKYDRNGNIIWSIYNDSSVFDVNSVATDNSGNIYISGYFQDSLILGAFQLFTLYNDVFIAKFDSNGNVIWAQQSNSGVNGYVYQNYVTTDKWGAVYQTGAYTDTVSFGSLTLTSDNASNFYLIKYNANGSILWGKQDSGADSSSGWTSCSICTDDSNHIYISGGDPYGYSLGLAMDSFTFSNKTFSVNFSAGTLGLSSPSFLLKLDSSGNVLCGSTLPDGSGEQNAVTADSTGKFVYLGGVFYTALTFGNSNLYDSTGGGDSYVGRWQSCEPCDFTLTVNPPASVCRGYSDTLRAVGGEDYTWSPSLGLNATTGSTVIATPTATVTYTVIALNSNGCGATGVEIVNIIPSPNKPSFVQHDDTLISSSQHDNQWYRNDSLLLWDTSQYLIISTTGNYYVEVNNEVNGCSTSSDTLNISSLTGINQLTGDNGQLTVYPNPTSDQLTVISNQLPANEIDVADELGQFLLKIPTTGFRNEIDLSSYPAGIYFISVINGSGRTVVPVVKE
jgi:hypothetical protein